MKKLLTPILYTSGWLEATWVERIQVPATESEPGTTTETQVWCQSYHPTQIDMLRAKAAEYGTPLDEYEPMLAEWVASYEPPEPVVPTPEQMIAAVTQAVQERLDAFARTRAYDGILSAATYAASAVPKFAAEGQYAVQARDASWAACYQIMADVQSGTRAMPSVEDVLAELPALEWPQ